MRHFIMLLLLGIGTWLLTGCGGASSGTTVGQPSGVTQPGPEPIRRQAECAFPERMQVGRPATIRFSIFTPGNQPRELPSTTAIIEPLEIPNRPDLQAWVAVTLHVNGQQVSQNIEREFQQLSQRSNIWIWQVTPTTAQPLTLQPIVDVEYRDASGRVVERQKNIWTQTYTVEDVVGSNYGSVVLSWLGNSVSEMISGMIGSLLMAIVVNPTRNFFTQRVRRKAV